MMNAETGNDVGSMSGFFRENPYFLVPWVLLALVQVVLFNYVPPVVEYCQKNQMEMFGLIPSLKLAAYGIASQFAVHGFVTCYATSLDKLGLKIQESKNYLFQAERTAMRASLILFVTMTAYAITPMRSGEASYLEIFVGYSILLIVHDAWFYCIHRAAHTKALYALLHKTHHTWKQPMAFSSYYIRSPSQVLQEHLCIIPVMLLLPVPMMSFLMYQYIGVPLSYVEHSGYRLGDLPLPVIGGTSLPFLGQPNWGHVFTMLGGGWSLLLGGQSVDMHDEHHMNFHGNYGLSYSYLDHLLGTYIEPTCKEEQTKRLLEA
eukprot:TRINITY_DN1188_c0_g2_i1.p1 TRINITY_DN1188_c0_g2~~TRINITY_DN1188_c0_g2_i1.p1  ORF type:complete len:318 (-),score=83.99 TRINITY_DN1188_c0_g2_i1:349-1302(-)